MSTDTYYDHDALAESVLFPSLDVDMDDWDEFAPYCDLCEREGHSFRSCARRDDVIDAHLDDMGD